jgi:ketosteroid isomerase-like protein
MGDRAVTEWRFTCTMPDGTKKDVDGCDIFHLRDGKIAVKSTYRKQSA